MSHKTSAARRKTGRTGQAGTSLLLAWDRDEVLPVRLVEAEPLKRRQITVAVEAERNPDQRRLGGDSGGPDRCPDLRPRRRARLARAVDRGGSDLRGRVRRCTEVLAVAAVLLLEARDDLGLRIQREVRVVDVRSDTGERRIEEAVRPHQLDASLAGSLHLVAERLTLRRQLPGDVDDLRVTRELRNQRREVRLLLADAVSSDGGTSCP